MFGLRKKAPRPRRLHMPMAAGWCGPTPASSPSGRRSRRAIGGASANATPRITEAPVDRRTRLDPLDPATFRHAPQCEHRDTTDPDLVRVILRVQEGGGEGYWWVTCGICEHGWQIPHYAASAG
jgi:hypothetical protein